MNLWVFNHLILEIQSELDVVFTNEKNQVLQRLPPTLHSLSLLP